MSCNKKERNNISNIQKNILKLKESNNVNI